MADRFLNAELPVGAAGDTMISVFLNADIAPVF